MGPGGNACRVAISNAFDFEQWVVIDRFEDGFEDLFDVTGY
jgi:hypothetical protein